MGSVIADEQGNPFYDKYKDHALIWPSLPGMAIMTMLAVIGLVGNLSVAIVTLKHRHLRTNCNILLAMACIGDTVHQSAHYITSVILFTGLNFIPLHTCLHLQTFPLIGLSFGLLLTLLIGIDRLISVSFPVKYRRIDFKVYIVVVVAICSAYAFVTIHKAYKFMAERPDAMVTCLIVDAIPGKAGDFWFQTAITINLSTVLIYLLVWLILRIKTNSNGSTRRIFKSLTAIMCVILLGWVLNSVMRIFFSMLHADPIMFYHAGVYGGCFVNAACASNALILFVFSQDYKRALGHHFSCIANKVSGSSKLFTESRPTDFGAPSGAISSSTVKY